MTNQGLIDHHHQVYSLEADALLMPWQGTARAQQSSQYSLSSCITCTGGDLEVRESYPLAWCVHMALSGQQWQQQQRSCNQYGVNALPSQQQQSRQLPIRHALACKDVRGSTAWSAAHGR